MITEKTFLTAILFRFYEYEWDPIVAMIICEKLGFREELLSEIGKEMMDKVDSGEISEDAVPNALDLLNQ